MVPEDNASLVSRDEYRLVQEESKAVLAQTAKPTYKGDYKNYDKGKDDYKGKCNQAMATWVPRPPFKAKGKGDKSKGK